jgi:hypothetical protein
VYGRHSCRKNFAVSSGELYQVGIEHRHKVHLRKNSTESLKKIESLRSSMKLCQVGIE